MKINYKEINNKEIDFFFIENVGLQSCTFGFYQPFRALRINPVVEVIKHEERKELW